MKDRFQRQPDGSFAVDVTERGQAVLADGLINRGTVFTEQDRTELGLHGLLPSRVSTEDEQVRRAYESIARKEEPLEKYIGLAALQDRNETLYYKVVTRHLAELMPIVYTPTVGLAAQRFSHIFRRGRGIWITPADRGRISTVLGNARTDHVRLIVATDNERILGLGDQGAGGMVISIGKLALYSAVAGIHPAFTLPVSLDVGTDNADLLHDPLYVGWRQPRLRGDAYYELLDEFVDAVHRRFPHALLQWEDFKKGNAFGVLDRYRNRIRSFNDDIQGTAAVALAGVLAAGRCTQTRIRDQRVVLLGAGAAGIGIAGQLRHAMQVDGLSGSELERAIALVDSSGLVVASREGLDAYKAPFAWSDETARAAGLAGGADLVTVVRHTRPTALIGTSGQSGTFTEEIVATMAAHCERPAVLPFSNPTEKCEATPEEIASWSGGRALIATGSPFPDVEHARKTIPVRQGNNVYVFPAVGLGALVSEARVVTDGMFTAAAHALAEAVSEAEAGHGALYPPIDQLREISRHVAIAVVKAARDERVGRSLADADITAAVDAEMWDCSYPVLNAR